jgi:hypothetical protein
MDRGGMKSIRQCVFAALITSLCHSSALRKIVKKLA